MDIPVPDPPTLPSPLPAIFKADTDMYGATAEIIRAPDAGYAATAAEGKAEMVDERKQQTAKVFFFRFNSLPDSAKRACEGIQAIPGSKDMELRWKKYKGMEQRWQNACIGMPNNTTKSIDAYWFLTWVGAHVSHHDWIVVTSNIRLQYHRWKLNLPPPEGHTRAACMREAERLFRAHKDEYVARLEQELTKPANAFPHLKKLAVKRKAELYAAWKKVVQKRLDTVKEHNPYPVATTIQDLTYVPKDIITFSQRTLADRVEFFNTVATDDVYAAFYNAVSDAVSIALNLDDKWMGTLMTTTVVHTALAAEKHFLRPYYANERFSRLNPNTPNPDPKPIMQDLVQCTFQRIQQETISKISGFPRSIEQVLVPNSGRSQGKKRPHGLISE